MKQILFSFLFIISCNSLYAQRPGDLDSTFGVNGIVVTEFEGYDIRINEYTSDGIKAIMLLDSGNFICAGTADNGKHFLFTKYKTDGTLDLEFATEGKLIVENLGRLTCAGKNQQSKFIAAGYNDSEIVLIKMNEFGELDEEFGEGGIKRIFWDISGYTVKIRALDFQDDNKIILVGDAMSDTFAFEGGIILYRLYDNGIVDSTFGENGRAMYYVSLLPFEGDTELMPFGYGELNTVKILTDNKIVAGGHFLNQSVLIQFNSNGSVDNSFGIDGSVKLNFHSSGFLYSNSRFYSLKLDYSGRLIASGFVSSPSVTTSHIALGCVNNEGITLESFGENGKMVYDEIDSYFNHSSSVSIQDDNKIISSGFRYFSTSTIHKYSFEIIRFHENGSIDSTFGEHGIVRTLISDSSLAFCSALQDDGKLLVAGVSDSGAFTIARYHAHSDTPTSILPLEKYNTLLLYPNPVSDILFIDKIQESILQIDIRNILGREIHLPINDKSIDVSSLPSGLYFIKITTDKGESFGKFVKE